MLEQNHSGHWRDMFALLLTFSLLVAGGTGCKAGEREASSEEVGAAEEGREAAPSPTLPPEASGTSMSYELEPAPEDIIDIMMLAPTTYLTPDDAATGLRIRDVMNEALEAGSRKLVVQGCYEECLEEVLRSDLAPQLVELRVEECAGRAALRQVMEAHEELPSLRHLRIVACTARSESDDLVRRTNEVEGVNDEDFATFLGAELSQQLVALGLPAQQLCRPSLEALTDPYALPNLQALDIRLNHCLSEEDITWWLDHDQRQRLEYLNLSFNRLTEGFERAIERRRGLPSLSDTELDSLSPDY